MVKFNFSLSKLRKQPILLKMKEENVKFQNPGGQATLFPLPTPMTAKDARSLLINSNKIKTSRIMKLQKN